MFSTAARSSRERAAPVAQAMRVEGRPGQVTRAQRVAVEHEEFHDFSLELF
jgi:hypothetical protein